MSYIFMDESGCLGFDFTKRNTSRYFIVTFLLAANKRPLEKIVRTIFSTMPQRERRTHTGVLHASHEKPRVRARLLSRLSQLNVSVMAIRLDKKRVYTRLQDEKPVLYNYVSNILLDRIITRKLVPVDMPIHIIAAQRETNRFLNDNFRRYMEQQNNRRLNIDIAIRTPAAEKGLQVADCVSWALFRNYEYGDDSYMNMIRHLIVEDKPLFT